MGKDANLAREIKQLKKCLKNDKTSKAIIKALGKITTMMKHQKAYEKKCDIKFGQVWKAVEQYKITEWWSPQVDCVIPVNTRVVVLNNPVWKASHFHIMPVTTKGLNRKLIPNLKEMEQKKEGFGVSVSLKKFRECFALDKNQKIVFDNPDAKKFWKDVTSHR